ncbi:MAG: hypothetical protein LBV80_07885 [Deltaproteobacteria bacterium]|jgi:hypothetical protein|nr:hypothetical protein [Deltaproteobacteria bacterium]
MARRPINTKALNDKIVKSGKEFNDALIAQIEAVAAEADGACREAAFGLYTKLVEGVPKDTARAAAGFNINPEPSEWVPPPGDYKGQLQAASQKAQDSLNSIPVGGKMTISNNIEYLADLENGHSQKQAPNGFIAIALRNFTAHLQKKTEELRRKKIGV